MITAKQFIPSVPGQNNRYIPSGKLRYKIRRIRRCIRKRLIIPIPQSSLNPLNILILQDFFTTIQTILCSHNIRIPGLVIQFLFKPDCISVYIRTVLITLITDNAGINTPAQKTSHRNIRYKLLTDRIRQQTPQLFTQYFFLSASSFCRIHMKLPILMDTLYISVLQIINQNMGRQKLIAVHIHGFRLRYILIKQIVI